MRFFPNSDGARESGKKAPAPTPTATKAPGPALAATGKIDDVLTRLGEAVVKALRTGGTLVDGKELDHAQAEELRQLLGQGYQLVPNAVESLSHMSAKMGGEVWGRGWKPDASSRITFNAVDVMGQSAGTYGLALTLRAGQKPGRPMTGRKAEANTVGTHAYLLHSGFRKPRRR